MTNEQNSGRNIELVAPYTSFANPNFGVAHSIASTFFMNPPEATPGYIAPEPYPSILDNRFTTYPQYPIKQGGNASEIIRISESKTLYNHIHTANNNIASGIGVPIGSPFLTFKSDQERMKYIQGRYSLRYGYSPSISSNVGISP